MTTVTGTLTILTDNTVPGKSDLLAEHGFSIYLETSAGNYLFDTGKGKTIVHNANLCRKDLSREFETSFEFSHVGKSVSF